MRDIRGDLQERAGLVEQQINAAQNQFKKVIEQLRSEQDSRAIDLKAALNAVNKKSSIDGLGGPPISHAFKSHFPRWSR